MSLEERQKILYQWNDTKFNYPYSKTLSQLFEEEVNKFPKNIAVIYEDQFLSYQDLNDKANQLAHFLRALGVSNNTLAALLMEPSIDLIISIIAVLKAGGAYVPLDTNNPLERQKLILEDSNAKVLITKHALNLDSQTHRQLIVLDRDSSKIDKLAKSNPACINHPDNLAYVIYTSGSTGKPKGVMVTHRNVNNFIHWYGDALSVTDKEIFDFSSSISFDFTVANTLFPLMKGAKIAICSTANKSDFNLYLKHLKNTHVSIIKITPSHFRQLKEVVLTENIALELKYIVLGGESLFASDVKDWLERFPSQIFFCEYGPTETTIATSWIRIDKNNIQKYTNRIPIGRPAFNTQLYILDKKLQPVAVGEIGELYIGGHGVSLGYINREELTKNKFINNPYSHSVGDKLYKTGDLCRYLPDGNIEFIGREDHQVKIRGFRVELAEIESCLMSHSNVKEVAVISKTSGTDQTSDKQLIAYCVLKTKTQLDLHQLRLYLRQYLPEYMIPSVFMFVPILPLDSNGKLDRNRLPPPTILLNNQEISPRNDLELVLKQIWAENLNTNGIGITENFFDLGGHSLAAARIIFKIKSKLNKEISLEDFYRSPTIYELANLINQSNLIQTNHTMTNSNQLPRSEIIPLNELQFLFWLFQLFFPKTKILNIVSRIRVNGKPDIKALDFTFKCVLKKHPVLCYYIMPYFPRQYPQNISSIEIIDNNIQSLSIQKQEIALNDSVKYLENYPWKKGLPLITARLFYLADNKSELQIAISHFISDEISAKIIVDYLSQVYLDYKNNTKVCIDPDIVQYKDYILQEKLNLNENLDKDIDFWNASLNNITFPIFPKNCLPEKTDNFYTNYFEISPLVVQRLRLFCNKNRISITAYLSAIAGVALAQYINNNNKTIVIGVVKSSRDNDIYDKTIGLFLRTDLILIDLNNSSDLLELSKRVQDFITKSTPYQSCPIIIKLAYALKQRWQNKVFFISIIDSFAKIYGFIFRISRANQILFSMFCRFFLAKSKHDYLIDLNITSNFMLNDCYNNLFGLSSANISFDKRDRLIDKDTINIWFDYSQNFYLIISAYIKLSLREQLGKNIMNMLDRLP